MPDSTEARYRLLPTLRAGRLGNHCYVYDELARGAPVVSVPTQRVSTRIFEVIGLLRDQNADDEPWPLDRIRSLFGSSSRQQVIDLLVDRGYIERVRPAAPTAGVTPPVDAPSAEAAAAEWRSRFDRTEMLHHFVPRSAFGLPAAIDDEEVDVALAGVPLATVPVTAGTSLAPAFLRVLCQQRHSWFDVWARGVLSEVGLSGGLPAILCKGVMAKDYGDLGSEARTVAGLFATVRRFVDTVVRPHGISPLFLGGDHAVTFPLVHALLECWPDLCLIQLDAHNDLLYLEAPVFEHGAVVTNLLDYSGLCRVVSLGLRSDCYGSGARLGIFASYPSRAERVRLYSIGALRRLLAEPGRMASVLAETDGRPCYVTIDLDVLTPAAIGGRVATPSGSGLGWWELLELVDAIFDGCRVIGADVVELDPTRGAEAFESQAKVVSLLLHLIHGLARHRSAGAR